MLSLFLFQKLLKLMAFFRRVGSSVASRMKTYLTNIAEDYKIVASETLADAKARPIKALFYGTLTGTTVYAAVTNPDDQDYMRQITQDRLDLLLVGPSTRNKRSEQFIDAVTLLQNRGCLRRTDCVLFSLMWRSRFDPESGHYAASCKALRPTVREFLAQHTVDVGVFGKWFISDRAMADYDVQ